MSLYLTDEEIELIWTHIKEIQFTYKVKSLEFADSPDCELRAARFVTAVELEVKLEAERIRKNFS